jgi:hypothetical protein
MKLNKISILLAALALSLSGTARADGVSIIKDMPEALFAPPGFDSNDHAQLVLSGTFINTCFKVGPNKAEVDVAARTIHVTQQAYVLDSPWCLHVLVPYTTVVDVGILPPGDYDVHVRAEASREKDFGKMGILKASDSSGNNPDEKLYAMVDEVSYENEVLTLKGKLPGACTRLKEVVLLTRKNNIVEVLPLAEVIQPGVLECASELVPFERKVPFKAPWKGTTLFHVRSLNGQSINKVYDLK